MYNKSKLHKLKKVNVIRKFIGESTEQMRIRLQNKLKDNGINPRELIESEDSFRFKDQFVMKPKSQDDIEGVVTFRSKSQDDIKGVVTFRSKDYYFESDLNLSKSYGEIDAKNVTSYGWFIECYNNSKIEYHII